MNGYWTIFIGCLILSSANASELKTARYFVSRIASAIDIPQHCDWQLNKCYHLSKTSLNWIRAEFDCQSLGIDGHLVEIASGWENLIVLDYVIRLAGGEIIDFWMGANNLNDITNFVWSSNSPLSYSRWAMGYPQKSSFANCVAMDMNSSSEMRTMWYNTDCTAEKHFVCETSLVNTQNITTTMTMPATISINLMQKNVETKCPDKWAYFEKTNSCYLGLDTEQTWEDAEASCQELNAHLVSIHSIDENNFIGDMIVLVTYDDFEIEDMDIHDDIWIGLHRIENNSKKFRWTDNSPFDFANWAYGEPSSDGQSTSDYCVKYDFHMRKWNEQYCGADSDLRKMIAVCKQPIDEDTTSMLVEN